jgi:hypothetical protein
MEFRERQYFRQWWLIAIIIVVIGLLLYGAVQQLVLNEPWGNVPMGNSSFIVLLALLIFLFGSILFLRLETTINDKGIHFGFFPFQRKGIRYSWSDIAEISVIKYSPLIDYGGWGWRISMIGKGQAYNVSGNKGIQVKLKNGKTRLIGTQKPEEAEKVISGYFVGANCNSPQQNPT